MCKQALSHSSCLVPTPCALQGGSAPTGPCAHQQWRRVEYAPAPTWTTSPGSSIADRSGGSDLDWSLMSPGRRGLRVRDEYEWGAILPPVALINFIASCGEGAQLMCGPQLPCFRKVNTICLSCSGTGEQLPALSSDTTGHSAKESAHHQLPRDPTGVNFLTDPFSETKELRWLFCRCSAGVGWALQTSFLWRGHPLPGPLAGSGVNRAVLKLIAYGFSWLQVSSFSRMKSPGSTEGSTEAVGTRRHALPQV